MSNPYFQFKQFTVQQSRAALKVCTESCLFGAYVPVGNASRILDIGTGTGLLALMLAQRSKAEVYAVELDEDSCKDAQENFEHAPWKNRLHLVHSDIHHYIPEQAFDLMVCNPPFFINQLKSADARTNLALHGSTLKPMDLCPIVDQLATEKGRFYVLLPESETVTFIAVMQQRQWQLIDQVFIHQEDSKSIFRMILGFGRTGIPLHSEKISIYNSDRSYTESFKNLLKEYYLYL